MDINKNNFGNRKGSANPNMLDFTLPHDSRNRNFKQKVSLSIIPLDGEVVRVKRRP